MSDVVALRAEAEALGQTLPALLAEAEHLSSVLSLGEHGRRSAGPGVDFWQYRPAMPGDNARLIDWRRSAKTDAPYLREREWHAAQSVIFWADPSSSMRYRGAPGRPTKFDRAQVLALALAISLLKAGERVGVEGQGRPRPGMAQLTPFAMALGGGGGGGAEFGTPSLNDAASFGRAVVVSDFLGDPAPLKAALMQAAGKGVRGILLQVLDQNEESFPFAGHTVFLSLGGGIRFETRQAGDLRARYLDRLAERKSQLADLARAAGWKYSCHHTETSALPILLWAQQALAKPL